MFYILLSEPSFMVNSNLRKQPIENRQFSLPYPLLTNFRIKSTNKNNTDQRAKTNRTLSVRFGLNRTEPNRTELEPEKFGSSRSLIQILRVKHH